MVDPYSNTAGGLTAPFAHLADVAPGADMTPPCRGLYVGVAGDLEVTTIGGENVTFKNVPSGALIPVRALRVETTGTTASDIVAGW